MNNRMSESMKEMKEICTAASICIGCPMNDNCDGVDEIPEDWRIPDEQ